MSVVVYLWGARRFDFHGIEERNEKALLQVNWTGLFLYLMQGVLLSRV